MYSYPNHLNQGEHRITSMHNENNTIKIVVDHTTTLGVHGDSLQRNNNNKACLL